MTDLPIAGPKPAISEIDPTQLAAWLDARGEPAYRAGQVLAGAHRSSASSFEDLTDVPAPLRAALAADFRFSTIADSHVIGADGGLTAKAVHELADGQRIESVLMRYPARGRDAERTTICISSQAGCAVNCPFCATGQAGFGRQLTPGEIVDQVLHWHRPPWQALGEGQTGHYNVVFMGMGEPLNNADRVFESVRLLNDPAAPRDRRSTHHGQHLRRRAGHGPHGRRAAAGQPRDQPACRDRCAARRAGADQPQVADPRGHRRGPGVRGAHRPPGQPRVRDDRRPQRHRRAGRPAWPSWRAAGDRTSTSSRSTRPRARAGAGRRRPGSSASRGSSGPARR